LARKILLADDSVTAQNMGRKILADAGYDVATVNNGSAALKRIAELKPDLIVLDVYMPGYSGLEVCQRLKDSEETAHIPVLLSVGKLEPFKPEEARRVKADAHIIKPFEASELLTAITRLEDLLAAQPANGHRSTGVESVSERSRSTGTGKKSESNAGTDAGWKQRLGFSSKKKKDEKEEVDDAATGAFRDFRKGKRNGAEETKKVGQASGSESAPASEIPGDITPAELDALSALAAKLEGSVSAAELFAPPVDKKIPEKTVASTEAAAGAFSGALVSQTSVPEAAVAEAAVAEARVDEGAVSEPVMAAPAVAAPWVAVASAEPAIVEAPVFAVEGKSEVEIPAEHVELPTQEIGIAAEASAADTALVEPGQRATEAVTKEYSENQSSESQPAESRHEESQPSATFAPEVAATMNAALFVQEPACVDRDDEPNFFSASASTLASTSGSAEDSTASVIEQATEELPVVEDPAPSDAELVQALRLLTPANWNADASQQAAAGPRWVAEPMALSPEEASTSLEAEMFRTFAATPSADEVEAVGITGVAAIEAAVESTLAAAGVMPSANTFAEASPEARPEPEAGRAGEQNLLPQDSDHHQHYQNQGQDPEAKLEEISVAEPSVASAEMALVTAAASTENDDAGLGRPVETATSVQLESDEAPKAKAAAAAAEGGDSNTAPDASTIASIVDRVMADLRPKIVEEITRKLGGK
jgi:CheY-like chemotaxis protein